MVGGDYPKEPQKPQRPPWSTDLLVTWWERALAGIAVAFLLAFVLDIVLHCCAA
jgi:hypothetical protein